jgi:hypothetical protein
VTAATGGTWSEVGSYCGNGWGSASRARNPIPAHELTRGGVKLDHATRDEILYVALLPQPPVVFNAVDNRILSQRAHSDAFLQVIWYWYKVGQQPDEAAQPSVPPVVYMIRSTYCP